MRIWHAAVATGIRAPIEFPTPMPIKIISNGGTAALGHIRHFKWGWGGRVSTGSGNTATWMQPLIPEEQVPLGIRVALRQCWTR